MSLIDLIALSQAILAGAAAIVLLLLLRWAGVFRTMLDPSIAIFFQMAFTASLLILMGLLPLADALSFAGMLIFIVALDRIPWTRRTWIAEKQWLEFSKFLIIVAVVLNIWLLVSKGFVFLAEDAGTARLQFYEGWGIFKRVNECASAIVGISAFHHFEKGRRKQGTGCILFAGFLLLTLGSKAGLVTLLFLFGAYSHFRPSKVSALKLAAAGITVVASSLLLFFVIYGDQFFVQFGVRVMSYCDGPFYYYRGRMMQSITYPLDYVLDQFLVAIRVIPEPRYFGIGRSINWFYFAIDSPLARPNPQIFVTARVLFGEMFPLGYAIGGIIFVLARKFAATQYSFYLACMFAGPLFVDSPYAFSELFSVFLCVVLYVAFRLVRSVLSMATAPLIVTRVEAGSAV